MNLNVSRRAVLLLAMSCCVLTTITPTIGSEPSAAERGGADAPKAPLAVGTRVCLFLDDRFVDSSAGFRRVWHQGKPRPEVAIRDRASAWERWPHLFGSTLYDPEAKRYRMYYESAIRPSRTPPNSFTTYVCYAESTDGKSWTRPTLGLFEDLGSNRNNIVVHCAEFAKVFVDPLETDPAARLKMFVYLNGRPPLMGGTGECLLGSGDGLKSFFVHGNHYLGLLSLLYLVDGTDTNGGGDLQLTFSHDGATWHRHPERQALIGPSDAAPELFPTYVSINGPLEIGDEMWLYYTEANGAHPIAPFDKATSQIRAVVWRRDGFVSLDAAETATLTTPPLAVEGTRLVVNARCHDGGRLRAALLDEQSRPIPGFTLDDCEPLTGDTPRGVVRWKAANDLSALKTKAVRLKFEMTRGSFYSFRFDEP